MKEEKVKEYLNSGGKLFKILSIDTIRDGGTTVIKTSSLGTIYVKTGLPNPDNTVHLSYLCTVDNLVSDPLFIEYLGEQIEKYISNLLHQVEANRSLLKKLIPTAATPLEDKG